MANVLKDGLAWLTAQLVEHATEEVVYRRGAAEVVVPAVLGNKLLQIGTQDGIRVEWTELDLDIPADRLDFGAGPVKPERGDQVDVTYAYDAQTFEVRPLGDNEPAWRWLDPAGHTMLRVHTKHVDTRQFYS